jgi:hypothetical protein
MADNNSAMGLHQLYRHFDKDGILLYVGVSLSTIARQVAHKRSPWAAEIVRIEIEHCADRGEAERLEAVAILKEGPIYNVSKGVAPEKAKNPRGRPRIVAPRPWELEGVSRRSWYRKRKSDFTF